MTTIEVPCAKCGTLIPKIIGCNSDITAEFCGQCNWDYYQAEFEQKSHRAAVIESILDNCSCKNSQDGPCGPCVSYASVKYGIEI